MNEAPKGFEEHIQLLIGISPDDRGGALDNHISRRDFLKALGVVAEGLALSACAPIEAVAKVFVSSPRGQDGTLTPIPPTATLTESPGATVAPTETTTPTKHSIPEGWTAVKETREVGGRQVALNETGATATLIEGAWYPVDIKGSFHIDLFDPKEQDKDPRILELVKKINGMKSLTYNDPYNDALRHLGLDNAGFVLDGNVPSFTERALEGILTNQSVCYNKLTNEWEHAIDYVLPSDQKQMPNETMVMRAVIGWIRDGKYVSFTYRQTGIKEDREVLDKSGFESRKATTLAEGFLLWRDLINNQIQVAVNIPVRVAINKGGTTPSLVDIETAMRKLIVESPKRDPQQWKDNLSDPNYLTWALSGNNILKYMSDLQHQRDVFITHRIEQWRYLEEQVVVGKIPEPVARTITARRQ